ALIENLQREDLNPIEEAEGYKKLMETFDMRQEDVAKSVGKSRSAVANALRLNNLCAEVKDMVSKKALSQGHARTLITIKDKKNQIMLAEKIIKEELSVRKTEQLVSFFEKFGTLEKETKESISPSMKKYYSSVEDNLSKKFGTKVKIHPGKNKSKIEIEYYSAEDLERLLFELQ
ncbi:MAG: ParB/RepB/Spo0J family partition protein, partial [Oscillospiraceae bacterium]|nr:ParB/RepB/Spo0J family partition protein [Oscillospiraceae bacterium]